MVLNNWLIPSEKRIKEKNKTLFEAAVRIAKNTPVQGTAAELMKVAMINFQKALEKSKLNAKIILQIHDELILELPKDEQKKVEFLVKKHMGNVVKWEIPFKVSIRTGKNWEQVTK